MTRQNSIPSKADKNKTTFALIPFWDLCNHKEGKVCTFEIIFQISEIFFKDDY